MVESLEICVGQQKKQKFAEKKKKKKTLCESPNFPLVMRVSLC